MGSKSSQGENINHFNAIRIRITGAGNLKLKFLSYDEVITEDLVDLVLEATTNKEPTRLGNFKQQRAQLELKTTLKDETFKVNRILIFVKPIFTSFPG